MRNINELKKEGVKVAHIVATSTNSVIGVNNKMPWHIVEDLKHFRRTTYNHVVIMGRKTFESIGEPLPNRVNIVISKSNIVDDRVVCVYSIEDAFFYAKKFITSESKKQIAFDLKRDRVFIIGGGEIYKQTFPHTDEIFLTRIEKEVSNGDVFYPLIDVSFDKDTEWRLQGKIKVNICPKSNITFSFMKLTRHRDKVELPQQMQELINKSRTTTKTLDEVMREMKQGNTLQNKVFQLSSKEYSNPKDFKLDLLKLISEH